ncbi:MAG: hypothetical protein HOP21_05810 [Methylotenera sp.]|nr:hypothetical protein [Methylotenera sp.]
MLTNQLPDAIEYFDGLSIHLVWQRINANLKVSLSQFWLVQGAIADPQEATRRTQEAVCLAADAQGNIAGVSTVYVASFGVPPQPYYFFRTFIRPDCRKLGLVTRLFRHGDAHLAQCFNVLDNTSPRGTVIVTDNLRLKHPRAKLMIQAQGFTLLGMTAEKKEVWIKKFV